MLGKAFHGHFHLLYDLRTLLGPSKKVYVEIGVYHAGSLALMMQHPYETEIHDPLVLPRQVEFTFANIERFNAHRRDVKVHQRYSNDAELLRELNELPIDLLFIDGDHRASSVIQDFELYTPRVQRDGFIAFDDYHDYEFSPEVHPAVDLIVRRIRECSYPGEYEILGSLPNTPGAEPPDMTQNNLFLLRKIG